ncbi:unnamed protein product [Musa textilis]
MARSLSSCGLIALIVLMNSIINIESNDIGVDRNVARTWCIANPLANPTALQKDLDRLCAGGAVECPSILPGGACFQPNTLIDHVSVAYNLFYKAHQSQPSACSSFGDNTFNHRFRSL